MSDSMKHFYLEKMVGNTYAVYEEKVDGLEDDAIDVVLVSDHDRIVAAQKNHLDDIYTEELFRKEQAIAELRAEVERYKNLYEDYSSEVEELQHERRNLETTIARQAREAEVLKAVIVIAKRVLYNAGLRPPDGGTPTVETICEDLNDAIKKIAAIERAEGEKEHE